MRISKWTHNKNGNNCISFNQSRKLGYIPSIQKELFVGDEIVLSGFCRKCGAHIMSDRDRICRICGLKISWSQCDTRLTPELTSL